MNYGQRFVTLYKRQGSKPFPRKRNAKSESVPDKLIFLLYWLCQSLWLCGSQETVENSETDGNTRPPDLSPEKSVCRSRGNIEIWTWKQIWTDRFQIGKGVSQGCILSPCLVNFYAEYIMRNTGLDEVQAWIRIARRNINNLRYADDTTLMEENEELKSLVMKVKEDSVVQFSSVTQLCPTLCNPINHSTPGLPVHHQLPEFTQTHVHKVGDAIQPSHPLSSPSPPAPNPSQHQGLFQWVNSSYEVAKVL